MDPIRANTVLHSGPPIPTLLPRSVTLAASSGRPGVLFVLFVDMPMRRRSARIETVIDSRTMVPGAKTIWSRSRFSAVAPFQASLGTAKACKATTKMPGRWPVTQVSGSTWTSFHSAADRQEAFSR